MDNEEQANKIMEIVDNIMDKYNSLTGTILNEPNIKNEFLEEIKRNNIEYNETIKYILREDNYHTANDILESNSERVDFKPLIKAVQSLSIDEWANMYPNFYKWLIDNGFRYIPECDKGLNK